jgi:hypothetical protein
MDLPWKGMSSRLFWPAVLAFVLIPVLASAQGYKDFKSDEYGFVMKYPDTWVKIDKPEGNYYVVFKAPGLTENFRARIHVAAHMPVKDDLKVFLQELRKGINDLQKSGTGGKQEVKILDEGEFKCDVPGAYFFFIQAYEEKIKLWMDIVIVFYKHDQTLLRISCLSPSKSMESFHQIFNDVLVSVKFPQAAAQRPQPAPAPPPSAVRPPTQPSAPPAAEPSRPAARPEVRPSRPAPAPAPGAVNEQSGELEAPAPRIEPPARPVPRTAPAPAPSTAPRGPSRGPERPATGIVN